MKKKKRAKTYNFMIQSEMCKRSIWLIYFYGSRVMPLSSLPSLETVVSLSYRLSNVPATFYWSDIILVCKRWVRFLRFI